MKKFLDRKRQRRHRKSLNDRVRNANYPWIHLFIWIHHWFSCLSRNVFPSKYCTLLWNILVFSLSLFLDIFTSSDTKLKLILFDITFDCMFPLIIKNNLCQIQFLTETIIRENYVLNKNIPEFWKLKLHSWYCGTISFLN